MADLFLDHIEAGAQQGGSGDRTLPCSFCPVVHSESMPMLEPSDKHRMDMFPSAIGHRYDPPSPPQTPFSAKYLLRTGSFRALVEANSVAEKEVISLLSLVGCKSFAFPLWVPFQAKVNCRTAENHGHGCLFLNSYIFIQNDGESETFSRHFNPHYTRVILE